MPTSRSMNPSVIASSIVIFLFLFLGFNAYTTVDPGHNKVVTFFGKVRPDPLPEGFHVVNPLLKFVDYDLRDITHTILDIEVPSQDKLKTQMDVSIVFKLNPKETPTILQEIGKLESVIDKHIIPKTHSLLREGGKGVRQSQDFFLDMVQRELQTYMETGLREYLEPKGVIVTAVLFRDITLPKVVTDAVIQTKERQEQLEREKAQLQIVEQQAQQQVKQAEAKEKAATAEANAKKIQADAEAYRIEKEAQAQAKANKELAGSVTPELIRYNAIQRWDGKYPQTLMSGKPDGLILSLPGGP